MLILIYTICILIALYNNFILYFKFILYLFLVDLGVVMNKDFARTISLLRKEKKLSQKKAAADLGISQALLSHYEKGIRECGLDFVIKASQYYNVSTDYLLGITPQRNGATISLNDLPEFVDTETVTDINNGNLISELNQKLIINSIRLIYDIIEAVGNKGLTTEISNYFMYSVYKIFRIIYCSGKNNPIGIFSINEAMAGGIFTALQNIAEVYSSSLANGTNCDGFKSVSGEKRPLLSPEIIVKKYPKYASSISNLIKLCEDMAKQKIIKQ